MLRAFMMVRWAHEGLSGSAQRAVVFAENANEAIWMAAQTIDRDWPTTTGDWDAREIRTSHARHTARMLSRQT
ncbi:MAG: hypothetical protein ACYDH4_10150 [Candidatus Cryosericum sp.]